MRAMVLDKCKPIGESPLELKELPEPEPGPQEILVQVKACGVCRTDLHIVEGELPQLDHPVIPGHQIVGRVVGLGPGVTRFHVGDRVGIAWLRHTCGDCDYCRNGRENLCENALFTGYHAPGGYAEYTLAPEEFAYEIPDILDDAETTPLLCGGIIGYRSLKRCLCGPGGEGRTLTLYGFGSSAHIVIQIARHWGYKVYAVSRTPKHQRLALELGASWAGERPDQMPSLPEHAIIFAPAGSLLPEALAHLKKGGTVALAGIYMSDIPSMNYERHLFYEKNVHSVTANTRQDAVELLETAAEAGVKPTVTTHPLEKANQVLLDLKQDRVQGTAVLVP